MRDHEIARCVISYVSSYPLSQLDEHMEILVTSVSTSSDHSLTLVVNHLYHIASYRIEDTKTANVNSVEAYLCECPCCFATFVP